MDSSKQVFFQQEVTQISQRVYYINHSAIEYYYCVFFFLKKLFLCLQTMVNL